MISILCGIICVLCVCLWILKDTPAEKRAQEDIEKWFDAYMAHIHQGYQWDRAMYAADEMLKRVRVLKA